MKRGKKVGKGRADPKKISHTIFEKLELRIGQINAIKRHPKVKSYVLSVDLGPAERDIQIVASLDYKMKDLLDEQVIVLCNVEPELVAGIESQGMILLTSKDNKPVLLSPKKKTYAGVKVFGIMDGEYQHFNEIGE